MMKTCFTCRKFKVCEFSSSAERLFKTIQIMNVQFTSIFGIIFIIHTLLIEILLFTNDQTKQKKKKKKKNTQTNNQINTQTNIFYNEALSHVNETEEMNHGMTTPYSLVRDIPL